MYEVIGMRMTDLMRIKSEMRLEPVNEKLASNKKGKGIVEQTTRGTL